MSSNFEGAVMSVGNANALWILILGILSGGGGVICGGLVAGKTKADMVEPLKWGAICILLTPFLVGWLLGCFICYKSYEKSK